MRKLCITFSGIILVAASLFVFVPVSSAQSSGESIRSFDVSAIVNTDSSVNVTERIVYDFGTAEHHGIFRDIPVKYSTSLGNQSLKLSNIKVVDESGKKYQFTVSSKGKDEEIKIGDPNSTITGMHTYAISYTADRALGYFNDHDELYWNATGNEWEVPIDAATFTITLPFEVATGTVSASCYYGVLGSATQCANSFAPTPGHDGLTASFKAPGRLEAGEGLTAALGFPKGLIHEPTKLENAAQFVKDNWIVAIPLLTLLVMFSLWLRKGRDPRGRSTIIPEYDAPDNLTPLEVSSLMHQGMRQKDISAEIIELAVKGYLAITRTEEKHFLGTVVDYTFDKKDPHGSHALSEADTLLLGGLFGADKTVKMSSLKQKFYINIPGIKKSADASAVSKGYFDADPSKVRGKYLGLGFLVFGLLWLVSYWGGMSPVTVISLAAAGVIVVLFSFIMPRHSEKGVLAKQSVLGLKEYLQIAEKDRINFHDAPEKSPKLFEKLLPYAMVLGVEKAWAKEFEDIYKSAPSWYNDPYGGTFNSLLFVNSMSSFSSAAVSNLSSAPGGSSGSGGGGFSGGGGGGGGGGSW